MDSKRFDRLVRGFGQARSRRQALGALAGVALGARLGLGAGEGAGATHAGCRHDGKDCARAGQCCSGRCAANGTCQPCTGAAQCPEPPAGEPCQRRVCTAAGRCVIRDKAAGASCPDDGNPCTKDVCDASGACTHPNTTDGTACTTSTCQASTCACQGGTCTPRGPSCDAQSCPSGCCDGTTCKAGNADGACGGGGGACASCATGQRCAGGACVCDAQSCNGCCDGTACKGGDAKGACGGGGGACRVCASNETCSGGACVCDGGCVCPTLKQNCTGAGQCAEGCEGSVACGPIGDLGRNQCCRPLGAPCSNPGQFDECCTAVFEGGGAALVTCGPHNTCGGAGAECLFSSTGASGRCCDNGFSGECC